MRLGSTMTSLSRNRSIDSFRSTWIKRWEKEWYRFAALKVSKWDTLTQYESMSSMSGYHNKDAISPNEVQTSLRESSTIPCRTNVMHCIMLFNCRPMRLWRYCTKYSALMGSIFIPSTSMDRKRASSICSCLFAATLLYVRPQVYFVTPNNTVCNGSTGQSRWGLKPLYIIRLVQDISFIDTHLSGRDTGLI